MYESSITAKDVIETVEAEADIALGIPVKTYLRWLNELEQLLYSQFIRDLDARLVTAENGVIEADCAEEDIVFVYCGTDMLAKISPEMLPLMSNDNFYAVSGGRIITQYGAPKYTIYVLERPVCKTESNYSTETVKLPVEFIELVYSKLRGEAYKLANEDGLAAKWLADFNAKLEDFNVWLAGRRGYGK